MELKLEKINKSFGKHHVLKDLSFEAKSGKAFGLLGPNGAGKSTAIRIIMRMFLQDSGEVYINTLPNNAFKGKIGYLPEERGLYPKRVIADQMAYIGELRGLKHKEALGRAQTLLERFGAGEYFKRRLDTLSKGNQQKVQLALALINDPDIIILDEPFSGLDPVNAQMLKDAVRELIKDGKTVLFSSHQMNQVEEFCDDICIINAGKSVLSGNLKQIKRAYPRDNIHITVSDEKSGDFVSALNKMPNVVKSAKTIQNGVSVLLHNENGKSDILRYIAESGTQIDGFAVSEPTLEDIFIEKVSAKGGEDS